MLATKRKRKPTHSPEEADLPLRSDQKRCRKCGLAVPREVERCLYCRHAPWTWHPNARLLIITLLICLFLFVLFPILTNREKPYRVPVTDEESAP